MPSIDHEQLSLERRMRRSFLGFVSAGTVNSRDGWVEGWKPGALAIDHLSGRAEMADSPMDSLRLLRDLVRKGLIEERETKEKHRVPRDGAKPTPRHYDYRLTEKGSRLLNEDEPIDPDIFDLRD